MSETPSIATTVGFQRRIAAVVASMGALAASQAVAQSTIHVVENALPGGDGLTWKTAVPTVYGALELASAYTGSLTVTGIKVAQGRYFVTDPINGSEYGAIVLQSGLSLAGGFRGPSTGGDPNEQNPSAFASILDGDIGVVGEPGDNSINGVAIGGDFLNLDGFSFQNFLGSCVLITNGLDASISRCTLLASDLPPHTFVSAQVTGSLDVEGCRVESADVDWGVFVLRGRSVYLNDFVVHNATMRGCVARIIGDNSARVTGGTLVGNRVGQNILWCEAKVDVHVLFCTIAENSGTAVMGESPVLIEQALHANLIGCTLRDNEFSTFFGGAISLLGIGGVAVRSCSVTGHSAASHGGAIFADVDWYLWLMDCLLADNVCGGLGGGAWSRGWLGCEASTIVDNQAGQAIGAGAFSTDMVEVTSSIVWNNRQFGASMPPLTMESQVWAGTTTVTHSIVNGAGGTPTNLSQDPRFAGPGDYRLRVDSPAINFGFVSDYSHFFGRRDLAGMPRLSGRFLDAGCYEIQGLPDPWIAADFTTHVIPGVPGYRVADGRVTTDDFLCFLEAWRRRDAAADVSRRVSLSGGPAEFQVRDDQINNDDFYAYLELYRLGL